MNASDADRQEGLSPLDGITVVEYGTFHAGPGGAAILGDLGAQVIKVEEFTQDPERSWTEVGGLDISLKNGESIFFEISNRNKKAICLDIRKSKGRAIFNRMIGSADVFLCNLRKSTRKKMGLDYESLRPLNPNLIYAGVSGYGTEGHMGDWGAFDPLGQACSGMMYVTGSDDPIMMNMGILDQATAIAVSHAILTALLARERHGIGQEVKVSLYGTALWNQFPNLMIANLLSVDPCLPSDRTRHSPLRNKFKCSDGRWIIGTHHPEERYWKTFCQATGQAVLLTDPHYTNEIGGPKNHAELTPLFDRVFATRSSDAWIALLARNGLMFAKIQRIHDVRNDPQAIANQYVVPFDHPLLGNICMPGYPIGFSSLKAGVRSAAPKPGEHTQRILMQMGYSEVEIDEFKQAGLVR